jgi:hypothetical protein
MTEKGKKIRNVVIAIILLLALIQLYRPVRNLSNDNTHDISTVYAVPDSVKTILKTSCYDCHSNSTSYPWYANIQPVASWLGHHVNEGKGELNFSAFGTYSPRRQFHKMDEIVHQMDEHEMPLASYTLVHRDAVMSDAQRMTLSNWANAIKDTMKVTYPADSLKMQKRGPRK